MSFNPLSHEIIFRRPERLSETSEWQEHLPFGMLIVELTRPGVLVELGTHFGDSYCAFCQAVKELGLGTRCYAVDTWRGDPQTGFYGAAVLRDLREHHDARYSDFSKLLQMTFDDAAAEFKDGDIDLLHIDGFHTYEAVKHDFETWLPKMTGRGVILFHDTTEREEDFGVWKLWEELSGSYPHFEFEHGHGLGLVAVGSEVPEQLQPLLNAAQPAAHMVKELFESLGSRWRLESRYSSTRTELMRIQRIAASLADAAGSPDEVAHEERVIHPYGPDAAEDTAGYHRLRQKWSADFEHRRQAILGELQKSTSVPTISILIPVYKPPLHHFRSCVDSVLSQIWPKWELCICDDSSEDAELDRYLKQLAKSDRRVKVTRSPSNRGISEATNLAMALATGEFITFLDHDDALDPGAIAEILLALVRDPAIDVLYTDEDKIDEKGGHFAPYFKPDWSPDLLMSHPYTTHGFVVRRSLVDEVGSLRSEFDGSQDYDLMLRATEKAKRIFHIPKVLYHWRTIHGSAALDEFAKPWAHEAAKRAVQAALDRRGEDAVVETGFLQWLFRPRPRIKGNPRVSIIIPFRDGADVLRRCIDSIHAHAGYDNWEILLVDNESWEPETKALLESLKQDERCIVLSYTNQFNWSTINNWAVSQSRGDYLLFLNNDIQGTSDGWMLAMLEHAQRKEVAAVGARLLYPNGRIQHAGVVLGVGGLCAHACWYCPPDRHAYFEMDKLIRNYSAVTGACMMVRKEVFDQLGGFDERLRVAYNDIDFCLRAREHGYLIVYTPFAELIHFESATRGISTDKDEERFMLERWLEWIKRGDPYYNPNLSVRRFDFGLPYESETPLWKDLLLRQGL